MTRPDLRSERGVTMIAVMVVMLVATVVATSTLFAAQRDLPFSKASSDRKQAYAAAEAGIEYYLHQLTNDNDFWTKCTNVPASAPIVQKNQRPRKWRTVPDTKSAYAIELLPATGATCTEGSASSTMLDQQTGTFKIRSTGRAGKTYRSIVTEFRRDSFLDFLYFTHRETFSPEMYPDPTAAAVCENPRNSRPSLCADIRFISADMNDGPFHTNDDILACGGFTLGRNPGDKIEIVGPAKWQHPDASPDSTCQAGEPNLKGTLEWPAEELPMPATNENVENKAAAAYTFTGRTWIHFRSDGRLDVTTWPNNNKQTVNMAPPTNGVISVKNGACSSPQPPISQDYRESWGCANVTVYGTYSKSMTITSEKDIIVGTPVDPDTGVPLYASADLKRSGDHVIGLIADKFVRVSHAVSRPWWGGCSNVNATDKSPTDGSDANSPMRTIEIQAAMLSLLHSFVVDNHGCGDELGTLTIEGAIAQRFRGPVGTSGTSGRTGFTKNYKYDDRLRYRSPPYFLTPIKAAWNIMRTNEQVPAASGS